jgi:hypothetical protein
LIECIEPRDGALCGSHAWSATEGRQGARQ